MKCPICGSENPAGAKLCAGCGAELSNVMPKKPKSPRRLIPGKLSKTINKLILPATAAGLLLLILFVIVSAVSDHRNGDYLFAEQNVAWFADKSGETTAVFVDGKEIGDTINGIVEETRFGLDHEITLFSVNDGGKTVLYVLRGKKLTKIDDSENCTDFMLAASGEGIAYTVEDGSETALLLYDVGKDKSTRVQTAAQIECTALAPDGESLTYVMEENGEQTGYFYNGKKSVRLGRDVLAIGLSDGGKYLYTISESGEDADGEDDSGKTLCLYNKRGEKKRVIGQFNAEDDLYFNADHTRLLYSFDGKSYISVKGGEGEPFFKESGIRPILPGDTDCVVGKTARTAPVDSFYDLYFYSGNAIYQIGKDYDNPVRLASRVHETGITLSEDASVLYYLRQNNGLASEHDLLTVRTEWGNDGPDNAVTLAESILEYKVSADCERVYYLDGDLLYSADGSSGRSVRGIAEDVEPGIVLVRGDILYFRKGNDVYACANGKDAEAVLSDADFALESSESPDGAFDPGDEGRRYRGCGVLGYYFLRTDDAVYCTAGSKKPKKIYTFD